MTDSGREVVFALRERLRYYAEIGLRELPSGTAPQESTLAVASGGPEAIDDSEPGGSAHLAAESLHEPAGHPEGLFDERFTLPPGADPAQGLEDLRVEEIGDCVRCKLCRGRKSIVFGSGNARARLMFIGEGPGADEDEQGLPFVGRAGQKLTEMIEKGMGIPRSDCYIANIIKCRPPDNRDPEPDEIAACEGFLYKQIDIIRPKVIVALGRFAAQTLLRTKMPISALRGRFWKYRDTLLMPTFHPAFVLRQYTPENRRIVWEDLKKVKQVLEADQQ